MSNPVFWPYLPEYEMTEELEWLTDVMKCPKGEDRVCLRGDPRQSLQYSAYMEDEYMAEAKATSKAIVNEFYIPYWPSSLKLPYQQAEVPYTYYLDNMTEEHKGVGLFLINNTREYRSYPETQGGVVLEGETLGWGDTWGMFWDGVEGPFVWAIKDPLDPFQVEGSTMVSQTLSVLEQPVDFNHRGGDLWEVNIRATNTNPPLQRFNYVADQYKGIDIFDLTNMSGGTLSEQHFTEVDNIQSESGVIQSVATLGRPETLTAIGFHATDKIEQDEVKSWIYSRKGMLVPFWIRSNSKDFLLETGFVADPVNSNRTVVSVRRVNGLKAPFKVSVIKTDGTEQFLTCIIAQDTFTDSQVLVFKENTTRGWTKQQIKDMRIMLYARLDSDRVELKYEPGGNMLAQVPVRELYYDFDNEV